MSSLRNMTFVCPRYSPLRTFRAKRPQRAKSEEKRMFRRLHDVQLSLYYSHFEIAEFSQ